MLVSLFPEGLALMGISRERLSLRLHIHESDDELAARSWWADHTGVPLDQFRRSAFKRHNPETVRQNTGEHYRRCLCVRLLGSRELYQVLEGLVTGLARQPRHSSQWHDELDGSSRPA